MKIINLSWNRFIVPIERASSETNDQYVLRVANQITSFYERYTSHSQEDRKYSTPFRDVPLENMTIENNFCFMSLAGIPYCDVKFFIEPNGLASLSPGIDVLCHRDDLKRRGPMIGFMRKKWREFIP